MIAAAHPESVTIVGGGIIGLTVAHYLVDAGLKVTLIDKSTIAAACSHGNCGYICPSHVLPLTEPAAIPLAIKSLFNPKAPFSVKPRFSPALVNWMWQFARRCTERQMLTSGVALKAILDSSLDEYKRLIAAQQLDCQFKTNGLLYVLRTDHGFDEFAKTDKFLIDNFGVAATKMNGSELASFEPALKPGLAGAFLYPGDASVNPSQLNQSLVSSLKSRGVEFRENCLLTGVKKSSDRITHLETSQGELPVDAVVFATGAWSTKLSSTLECKIPIEPGKGYSVTMTRPEPCPSYPMLFPEHKVGVSPFENTYRLGSMMEFSGYDESIPAHRIQQLQDSAKPYLITPFTDQKLETWYGWRPMTWDSLPIIGQTPRFSNTWLATGHNMLGLSLATATGRLVKEMILREPTHVDPLPYSPTRF